MQRIRALHLVVGVALISFTAATTNCDDDFLPPPRTPSPSSTTNALHNEALRQLAAVKSTSYTHKVHVDESTGVFEYDCSGFVDYAINNTSADALHELGRRRPTARSYVELLTAISSGQSRGKWLRVDQPSALREGDILAWLAASSKPDQFGIVNTGHVMIVDAPPHERAPGEWVVPIIDSSFGHGGADPRAQPNATGLGRGTTVIVVESNNVVGYYWSESSTKLTHTTVVMGRIF